MSRAKSFFPLLYSLLEVGLLGEAVAVLSAGGFSWAWLGAALAAVPFLVFMVVLLVTDLPRTSPGLPVLHGATAAALGLALVGAALGPGFAWRPVLYALVSVAGNLAYTHWYSRLGRGANPRLAVGATLPPFPLEREDGTPLSSAELLAAGPTVLLLFRGSWCPLCMAQVREIAAQYRAITARGAQVVLVSPQSHEKTRALAARFDVPLVFAVDRDLRAARALGLVHRAGLPAGFQAMGYDSDTVYPTVIIADREGRVVLADQTDNYRVRPEPQTFLAALDAMTSRATA